MSILKSLFMNNIPEKNINSFEIITLSESGMRYAVEYEIVMNEEKAEVSLYRIGYSKGEDRRILEKQAVCDAEIVLKLLNDCALLSWDGFNGPHPRDVSDGIMFTLKGRVNDNKRIYATGSQNFPKHYRAFRDGLQELLK